MNEYWQISGRTVFCVPLCIYLSIVAYKLPSGKFLDERESLKYNFVFRVRATSWRIIHNVIVRWLFSFFSRYRVSDYLTYFQVRGNNWIFFSSWVMGGYRRSSSRNRNWRSRNNTNSLMHSNNYRLRGTVTDSWSIISKNVQQYVFILQFPSLQ